MYKTPFYSVWVNNHLGGLKVYQGYDFLKALHAFSLAAQNDNFKGCTVRLYKPEQCTNDAPFAVQQINIGE